VGVGVIQVAPQMRILVAIESVDLRKGIDGLAQLCREKLGADPFPDACSFFAAGVPHGIHCRAIVMKAFAAL
jgi:hypothetical protein